MPVKSNSTLLLRPLKTTHLLVEHMIVIKNFWLTVPLLNRALVLHLRILINSKFSAYFSLGYRGELLVVGPVKRRNTIQKQCYVLVWFYRHKIKYGLY